MDPPIASSVLRQRDRVIGPIRFRPLTDAEVAQLRSLGNRAERWAWVLVEDPFYAEHIRNCEFSGLVRIGSNEGAPRCDDGARRTPGLSGSSIHNCDIGRGVTIRSVLFLANYVVRHGAALHRIDELEYPRQESEGPADMLGWATVANENGSRRVPLIPGLLPADTWLLSRYPDCAEAASCLAGVRGAYPWAISGAVGTIGDQAVIQSTSVLRRVHIGPNARIEAAHRVSNAVVCSSAAEPSVVADGVVLEDAVVGLGCTVQGNVIARRVFLGTHTGLQDGARVTDVVLGDNSTVAGAEVSNCNLAPFHGQHHQSSFLIAAHIEGQDNIAAGAILGSNHNSRAADGELVARRGFWPALRTSVRHPSRFAAFTLLARGDYAYEVDVPYPFSLVSRKPSTEELVVMPGYWWMYNPYALFRNERKFQQRDRRRLVMQPVEYRFIAPDTAQAILLARSRLVALAASQQGLSHEQAAAWLHSTEATEAALSDPDVENSGRAALVIKSGKAFRAYREMMVYYAGRCVVEASVSTIVDVRKLLAEAPQAHLNWVVAGGQPTPRAIAARIADGIRLGAFTSWDQVHADWTRAWEDYATDRLRHALHVALVVDGSTPMTTSRLAELVDQSAEAFTDIARRARAVRRKDVDDPFRGAIMQDQTTREPDTADTDEDSLCRALEDESAAYDVAARQVAARLRERIEMP